MLPLPIKSTVMAYMDWLGLAGLVMMQYPTTNNGFMNAFVERWHQETSSFHLPVREMTITLDYVSYPLHLPVINRLIDHVPSLFDKEAMKILLMSQLDILIEIEAFTAVNVGARVRLTWLEDFYHLYIKSNSYVWVAMTNLLHLIDNTIFIDKSLTHIHVAYLQYVNNLDGCHEYTLEVVAYLHWYTSMTISLM